MYSAYKLNKQGDNIQPWCTPFPIWNQFVVPCPVLTIASWSAYRFLRRQVRWSGIPISLRIFHSLLWCRVIQLLNQQCWQTEVCVCMCECETLSDYFASTTIDLATQKNPSIQSGSPGILTFINVFHRKGSTRKPVICSVTGIGATGTCATTCPQMKSMHSWHHKVRGQTTGADACVNII